MNWFKKNIYHLAGLLTVVVLFSISVLLRQENHSVPLTRHHEWITAHTLITCEIWANNGGPSAYHFSPVYTYPGEGNQRRRMMGGVEDEKGDVYYVSYPPFCFLFAYYSTQLIGGPTTENIRTLNLAIHFLCAALIYLIGASLAAERLRNYISVAGITAAFLYLFSTGNLWAHGNLYFADMLVQLFIIAGIYCAVKFFRKQYANERVMLSLMAASFFLATYTEWLGLFLSFFMGITWLIFYFVKKEKRYLKAFFSIGIASALALALTLWQYSSIAGWEQYKEVATAKYNERSGHESLEESPAQFNLENRAAYGFLVDRVDNFYKMAENFTGIFALVLVVLFIIPKTRKRIQNKGVCVLIVSVLAASILLHYYLFFNFNALHDFSSLKTGFLFILFILVCIAMAESALNLGWRIVLFAAVLALGIDKGADSVQRYYETFPITETDWDRMSTGAVMKEYGRPDAAIFMNISSNPELVFAAGHNVFPVMDTANLAVMMNYYGNDEGQYYHHFGTKLEYILDFKMQQGKVVVVNRHVVVPAQSGSGPSHQK